MKNICVEHNLNGLTIRCFALLNTICTTACLALSKLNSEGYTCSCEGDIPSLISMHVANNLFKQAGFMCNPSQLDVSNNKILLAHCAIPLAMCTSYKFNTHFESNTGIGIKGELQEGDVTLFRINCKLDEVFISEGKILNNLSECDLCRTQVIVEGDNLSKLLTHTLGNHLILVYGKHRKELAEVLENLKFKQI